MSCRFKKIYTQYTILELESVDENLANLEIELTDIASVSELKKYQRSIDQVSVIVNLHSIWS